MQGPRGLQAEGRGAGQHEVGAGLQLHGGHDLAVVCLPTPHHRWPSGDCAWGENA